MIARAPAGGKLDAARSLLEFNTWEGISQTAKNNIVPITRKGSGSDDSTLAPAAAGGGGRPNKPATTTATATATATAAQAEAAPQSKTAPQPAPTRVLDPQQKPDAKPTEKPGEIKNAPQPNKATAAGGGGASLPPTEIGVRASPAHTPEEEISRNDHGNWLPDNTRPGGIDVTSLPKASLYSGGTTRDKKIIDRYERGRFKPQPRGFTAEQQALILARNDPKFKQLLTGQVKTRNLNQQQINEFVRGSDGVASDVIRQYQANDLTLNEALVLAKGSTWAPFVGNWLSGLIRDGKITRDQLLEMRAADASVENVRNGIDMVQQRSSWASDNTSQPTALQTPQATTLQTPQPTTAPVTGQTRNAFRPWPDVAPNAEIDNAPTRVVSPKPEPDKASGLGQTVNKFISGIRKRLNL
jgi:hypothetical protein